MAAFESLQLLVDLDASGLERKINTTVTSITGAFSKFEKLDFNSLFKQMDNINWTSIVGKLFSPANLIAFFSAMSAAGIIQAIQSQQQTATTQGTTGETSGQAGATTGASVQEFRTLGTSVGSLQDVNNAVTTFTALTGSITDAQQITDALGKAAETTGTTIGAVLPNLLTFLQNAGINTEPAIVTVIDNLLQSTQASGGLEGMGQIAGQLADFGTAAQAAKSPLSAISQQIVAFGAQIKDVGVAQATANQDELNQSLEGTENGLLVSGMTKQAFDNFFNTKGPVTAMDEIATHIKNVSPDMDALITSAFNLSENATVGASAFLAVQGAIDVAAKTANTKLGPALSDINKQWDATDTVTRDIGKTIATFETLFMNADAGTLNSDLSKTSGITTTEFAPGVPANAILDALNSLSANSSPNPTLHQTPSATTVSPSNSANLTLTFKGLPSGVTVGATSSSQQNGVNGLQSGAGVPSSNNITISNPFL